MNGSGRPAVTSVERRQWAAGWTCSVLLHAAVVAVSLGVMTNLRPAAEQEPFRWEVSLVESLQPDVAAESMRMAEATPPSQPPQPPTQPAPVEPVQPSPQPIVRHVETKPVVEIAQQEVRQVVASVQLVQPTALEPKAVSPQPARKVEAAVKEVMPIEPLPETRPVTETAPGVQAAEPKTVAEPVVAGPAPIMAEAAVVATAPPVVHRSEPTSIAPVPAHSAAAVVQQQVVEQTAVTPITRNPVPIQDTAPARADAAPPPRSAVAGAVEPEAPAPTARETSSQIAMVPRSAPATKTDYSWLAESLWRRVVELKRYPHEARLNRWEGKVVLKAVIREDGHLGDLQIQKSSGYDILDQDAMELVRKACPLHLKHPLGRPEVVVQIPINYALR